MNERYINSINGSILFNFPDQPDKPKNKIYCHSYGPDDNAPDLSLYAGDISPTNKDFVAAIAGIWETNAQSQVAFNSNFKSFDTSHFESISKAFDVSDKDVIKTGFELGYPGSKKLKDYNLMKPLGNFKNLSEIVGNIDFNVNSKQPKYRLVIFSCGIIHDQPLNAKMAHFSDFYYSKKIDIYNPLQYSLALALIGHALKFEILYPLKNIFAERYKLQDVNFLVTQSYHIENMFVEQNKALFAQWLRLSGKSGGKSRKNIKKRRNNKSKSLKRESRRF